jgi:FkbM family methyltransferase
MDNRLIYDLGMHKGEDTEFYLKKGFRVVAVDANPELCASVGARLSTYVGTGQLTIINRAIGEAAGSVAFYASDVSEWGTISADWAERNARMGHPPKGAPITVEMISFAALIADHGRPYFVKIDIEGHDMTAVRALAATDVRPDYLSIEAEKISFGKLRDEFRTLQAMGYTRFKLVPQHRVPEQRLPSPPREGVWIDHQFEHGSSGAFGEEAPGRWLTAEEAINRYKRVFITYQLVGDEPLVPGLVTRALRRFGMAYGWYDTHAKQG